MFHILAAALIGSIGSTLTVWALHTPVALSCMYMHLIHLLYYHTDSLVTLATAEVGDIDFYVCYETRVAPHTWL